MRQGRYIVLCAVAFLSGDLFGGWVPFPAWSYLAAALLPAFLFVFYRRWPLILTTLFLLGAAAVQSARLPALPSPPGHLERLCHEMKRRCSDRIDGWIPAGGERGVAKALAIGDKRELDRAVRNAYRNSGASHLLALSGLHVGILYKLLVALLFPLSASTWLRRIRSLLVIAMLWCYAAISGLSPSISRAALMITFYEGAALVGRRSDGLCSLAASALLITLLDPESPREIGFQLSFSACLGIFLFHPYLKKVLHTRLRSLNAIWNAASLAISCQITTALPVWLYFRSFPKYFLITNLVTLPLVTGALYLTVSCFLLSLCNISPEFPAIFLHKCLQMLNRATSIISNL